MIKFNRQFVLLPGTSTRLEVLRRYEEDLLASLPRHTQGAITADLRAGREREASASAMASRPAFDSPALSVGAALKIAERFRLVMRRRASTCRAASKLGLQMDSGDGDEANQWALSL